MSNHEQPPAAPSKLDQRGHPGQPGQLQSPAAAGSPQQESDPPANSHTPALRTGGAHSRRSRAQVNRHGAVAARVCNTPRCMPRWHSHEWYIPHGRRQFSRTACSTPACAGRKLRGIHWQGFTCAGCSARLEQGDVAMARRRRPETTTFSVLSPSTSFMS